MKQNLYTIILSPFLIFFMFTAKAQWNIPEEAKNMKMPSEPTYELVKKGKELYYIEKGLNCKNCHGDPSKGNHNAGINAPDLGTVSFQRNNTAGEIFFKIKTGMGAMPSFANIHKEDQIWNIVYFIKSFDKNFKIYGQQIQAFNGKIDLKPDENEKKLRADITVTDENENEKPNNGIDIIFYVKRYFGDLPISEPVLSNEEGMAFFTFPEGIPGDEAGNLYIKAGFKDTITYGTFADSVLLNWGTPLHFKNEVLERTLWGPNNRVPLWLLFMYWGVTGGVWLGIFYVIFQITRIKKVGKQTLSQK